MFAPPDGVCESTTSTRERSLVGSSSASTSKPAGSSCVAAVGLCLAGRRPGPCDVGAPGSAPIETFS